MSYQRRILCSATLVGTTLVILVAVIISQAQSSDRPLVNADIIQMVREDVDEGIILRAIQTSEISFDISPNGLIQLRKGKVNNRLVRAIQEAQLKKNKTTVVSAPTPIRTTGTASSSKVQTDPSPPQPPVATPASKNIVATQEAEFFTFELRRCRISGTSIACFLIITNNSQDRRLSLYSASSRLIDSEGNEARGSSGKIANVEGRRVSRDLPGGIKNVDSWIRFDGGVANAHTISKLSIVFHARPGRRFELEFRNIPLER